MELTTIIGTCDSYSSLWEKFDIVFQRYWKPRTRNIFVGETKIFENSNYEMITPGKQPWGKRILEALELVDTKYVFFILEDYWLDKEWSNKYIQSVLERMEEYGADKYQMGMNSAYYTLENIKDNLFKFKPRSSYLTSIQPSIWKTDFLKSLMNEKYSPWDFEVKGTKVAAKKDCIILFEEREKGYFNSVRKGFKKSPGWDEFHKKENLPM